ncbi:MAG TPA: hypothetical protein VI815_04200 [Candidatus Nanoarchaeia archaeon]|nr:hypothetical protein [Candidatus Nanoarchaeia archaeon]
MLKIKNKKATSEIITSILIIFLTLVSISILSIIINNLVKNEVSLSPETNCIKLQAYSPINLESTCFDSERNETQIVLKRSLTDNFQIDNIKFVFSNSENNENSEYICGNQCGNCFVLSNGESKTYYISSIKKSERVSILANNCLLDEEEIVIC